MVPIAVPASAQAAAPPAGAAAPSAAAADCVRANPTDTRSPDQLRGKDSRRSGRAALTALGTRLAQAAVLNHRSAASLTSILESDKTAHLDGCSKLLYVEPTPAAAPVAAADPVTDPAPGSVSLAQAFSLNSRPGSTRTIYLDFKGGTYSGSFVCQYAGATPCSLPAFTQDADATTFSATELVAVYRIWQSVAEDYAPFDVNVSTQDLGSAALDRASLADNAYGTRVLITSDATWATGCGCGGMAYVSVWGSTDSSSQTYEKPAAVIVTANLGGGATKYVAEATSHEVGHNFGLSHDGTLAHGSTAAVAYYAGQGVWAPIMGVGYYKPVTQWSKGEYPYANNTQDDTAIIAAGAPLIADDVGNTPGTATVLASGTPLPGLITSPTDSDWFSFTSLGLTQLAVTPSATNPDLDVRLDVYAADGATLLETWNPTVSGSQSSSLATSVAGLEAHRSTTPLAAGSYYAKVTGTGEGDPMVAGYSSYSSLGRYTISMTSGPAPLAVSSTTPAPVIMGTSYTWTATTSGGSGGPVTWAVTSGTLPTGLSLATDGTVSGTATAVGSSAVTLTATDSTTSASATVTFHVYDPVTVTDATLPSGIVGSAYSTALSSSAGASATWSVPSPSTAPPGLTLASNGTLSGTPTTAGTWSFTARAYDPASTTSATMTVSLAVVPKVAVTHAPLADATTGVAWSDSFDAPGGTGTSTWSISAGSLPPGLSVTPTGASTATVSGTPTAAGSYAFTLSATNAATAASASSTASIPLSLRVADPLLVTTSTVPDAVPGVAYTATIGARGGVGPLTFSMTAGSVLPTGVSLSSGGVLSGTAATVGDYPLGVTVTDSRGVPATGTLTLSVVAQLDITVGNVTPMLVGTGTGVTITAAGGSGGPIAWTVKSGALPPGLSLVNTATLSPSFDGVATTPGSYTFQLAVDNTGSVPHAETSITIVVAAALAPATCALPRAMAGVAYAAPVPLNGGVGPFSYALTGPVPRGLTFWPDGRLTGTPSGAGSAGLTVQVFDSLNEAISQTCSLTVLPRLLVTTTTLRQPTLTTAYAVTLTASGGAALPRTWTIASGALPSGLRLAPSGLLAGTPSRTGTFVVTVRVRTGDGFSATGRLVIVVAPKLVVTSRSVLAHAHRGRAYTVRLAASGGWGTRIWTRASGALPPGLVLRSTGVISGKATKRGTFVVTVRVRDAAGRVATKRLAVVVR
jgi:hypothetical protein